MMNDFDKHLEKNTRSNLIVTRNRFKTKIFDKEILEQTPKRVVRMYKEISKGYGQNPKKILSKTFPGSDSMVTEGNIFFSSTCEHHLVPFFGKAIVSYIPDESKVVGISKLARIVECYAKRFQLQERMTGQIADAIEKYLSPNCAVFTEALHSCMVARGVKQSAITVTTALRGEYRKDDIVRSEWNQNVQLFAGKGILR